jgi:transposase
MNDTKYIGIDVHKATSVVAVVNHSGRLVAEAVLETSRNSLLDFIRSQRGTLHVAFEEGTYANWLFDVIAPHVAKLIVCDPRKIGREGSKTDRLDAKKLADRLREGSLKPVYHGEHSTRTLKELARSYVNLVRDCTRTKNRIKSIFRARGIDCPGQKVYEECNREEWLGKLSEPGARSRVARLLEQLHAVQPLCLAAGKEMVHEARKHAAYRIIGSVPGMGPIRAAIVVAFVMTPYRFRTKKQFWTYLGLAVVMSGSGEYVIIDGQVRRSKKQPLPRGLNRNYNHVLKGIFKGAAQTVARRGLFRRWFQERTKTTAPELVLLTMARKLSSTALTLWKKGEQFDPERFAVGEQTA